MTFHQKSPLVLAALSLLSFPSLLRADEKEGAITPLSPPTVLPAPKPHQTDEKRLFQGIPGIERTANGRLWAVWYGAGKGEDLDNIVMLSTSGDDGKTWSAVKTVIDVEGPVRCFDPVLWIDPAKRLWLFWAQAVAPDVNAHLWAMVTEDPGDENPKWQTPMPIAPGVMMNKPTVLASGDWLLPISDWEGRRLRTPDKATSNVTISKDDGKKFKEHGGVLVPLPARAFDEQMTVQRKDGSLLMLIRTNNGIGEATSKNGGKSWSPIVPSKLTHPSSRFYIRRLRSGNLLLVKHWPIDKKLNGRNNLSAFVSKDDGATWQGGLLLDERNGVSYPDGVEGDDGIIRIIYDFDRLGAKEILMAAFTEEDVLAAKDVSGKVRLRSLVNKAGNHPVVNKAADPVSNVEPRTNADGAPLIQDFPARWKSDTGKIAEFKVGARVFTNRPYTILSIAEQLAGTRFIQSPIESTHAVCTSEGVCFVITPSEGRNPDSLHAKLLEQGFTKAAVKEFLLFSIPKLTESNLMSTYQKSFKVGDEITLGKWGIIIIPEF